MTRLREAVTEKTKKIKASTTAPASGCFHKGEHKQFFAYAVQTACDKFGWVLVYDVNPANLNDIRIFKSFYFLFLIENRRRHYAAAENFS